MKEETITRRDFFRLLTKVSLGLASLLGLGGLVRFFSLSPDPGSPTSYELGKESDFPSGSKIIRSDIPAIIYNRGGDFLAISLSCTHLGCTLVEQGTGFSCPCHGSRFDGNGQVLAGPADQALPKLKIEMDEGGNLILFTNGDGK